MHAGTLLQIFDKATVPNPLPQLPSAAHMAAAPFSSMVSEQPASGAFLLRMLAYWYHAGGDGQITATGAPAGTQAWIGLDGAMLPTAVFVKPEGTYLLDVRCGLARLERQWLLLLPSSQCSTACIEHFFHL
jgi:hypothetical protein